MTLYPQFATRLKRLFPSCDIAIIIFNQFWLGAKSICYGAEKSMGYKKLVMKIIYNDRKSQLSNINEKMCIASSDALMSLFYL